MTSVFFRDLASVENAIASLPSLCSASQCTVTMEHALGNCSGRSSEQAIRRQMEALQMLCSPCLRTTIGMKRDCTDLMSIPAQVCSESCKTMVNEWNTENCNQILPTMPFDPLASMGHGRLLSDNLDEIELLKFMVEELVAALSRLGVNSSVDGEIAAGTLVEYFASVGVAVATTKVECGTTQESTQTTALEVSTNLMTTTSSLIDLEMDDVDEACNQHSSLLAEAVAVLLLLGQLFS